MIDAKKTLVKILDQSNEINYQQILTMKSTNKNERKKHQMETKHNFYLSFFDKKIKYEEKEINGFWLVKSFNTETNQCQVSLFSQESFQKYKTDKRG